MAHNPSKPWTKVENTVLIYGFRAAKDQAATMRHNVDYELTNEVIGGVTFKYFQDKPVAAMSDWDWYQAAKEDTILESVKPSATEVTFVRKITYENGIANSILNPNHFSAKVVKHAIDNNKVFDLNKLLQAVTEAWNEIYPHDELDDEVRDYAYMVASKAVADYLE
jgi:hypothetical protein